MPDMQRKNRILNNSAKKLKLILSQFYFYCSDLLSDKTYFLIKFLFSEIQNLSSGILGLSLTSAILLEVSQRIGG